MNNNLQKFDPATQGFLDEAVKKLTDIYTDCREDINNSRGWDNDQQIAAKNYIDTMKELFSILPQEAQEYISCAYNAAVEETNRLIEMSNKNQMTEK